MLPFIIAAVAIWMVANRIHTTAVYILVFAVGVSILPSLPALQLTVLAVATWGAIESALAIKALIIQPGRAFGWRVGNLAIAYLPQVAG